MILSTSRLYDPADDIFSIFLCTAVKIIVLETFINYNTGCVRCVRGGTGVAKMAIREFNVIQSGSIKCSLNKNFTTYRVTF